MQKTVTHLWSVPVYETNITVAENLVDYVKNSQYERVFAENGSMSKNLNVLDDNIDLKNKIENEIKKFLNEYIGVTKDIKFVIKSSWIVKHKQNDYAHSHYHKGIFTGVYYVKAPENCGNLVLHNNPQFNNCFSTSLNLDFEKRNLINCEGHSIKVEEGKLVIFPSQVYHSTEKNINVDDRYCIAFDIFIGD